MKITFLTLFMILGVLVVSGQSFFFGVRSGGGGCNNCSTFLGCFFFCGRTFGPSIGRRRKRFAKELFTTKDEQLFN
eukprot:09985.XXX_185538_186376_1 [CDS] Oithona nana genome sequencing.